MGAVGNASGVFQGMWETLNLQGKLNFQYTVERCGTSDCVFHIPAASIGQGAYHVDNLPTDSAEDPKLFSRQIIGATKKTS